MHDVVVVGGSQAGLAMAYRLKARGVDAVVLDQASVVGAAWRNRYDSLRLFTPAQYSSLPGLPLGLPYDHYPSKDEVADYLLRYVVQLGLDVRLDCRVEQVTASGDGFRLRVGREEVAARRVVVATGQSARVVPSPLPLGSIPASLRSTAPTIATRRRSRADRCLWSGPEIPAFRLPKS